MKDGVITQCAPPKEIYENPNSQFAGWFLGNPGINFIEKEHLDVVGSGVLSSLFSQTLDAGSKASQVKVLGVRAEAINVMTGETPNARSARVLRKSLGIGGQYLLDLEYGTLKVKARVTHQLGREIGDHVWTTINNNDIIFFNESGDAL